METPAFDSDLVFRDVNMEEFNVVLYMVNAPQEYVSEGIISAWPDSMQPQRRTNELMSSGNNFRVDHRISDSFTWLAGESPFMYDPVQDVKPVESLQMDFVEDSTARHYEELKVVTAENININDNAIYEVTDININDNAIYEVTDININDTNNQGHDANNAYSVDDDVDSNMFFDDDFLIKLASLLEDPTFSLDDFLNDYSRSPLPKMEEEDEAKPDVVVDAATPQLQSQVPETQVQVPLKRGRGRPRKYPTDQKPSMQKKHGTKPSDVKFRLPLMLNDRLATKANVACQNRMSTSMSEEDTSCSSFDEDYKPDCIESSLSRGFGGLSLNVQDYICSSTTSQTVGACYLDKKERNNRASKESRARKKVADELVKTRRAILELKNELLKTKAAEIQKAINFIWSSLRS